MTDEVYTIDEIKSMIADVVSEYEVEKVYLFGSYARQEATSKSDIDLYIPALPEAMGLKYYGMLERLKEITGKDIDIITDDSVFSTPEYKMELFAGINSDKVLIYSGKQ